MPDYAERFGKVAVLMGGISAEREVSLRSGKAILEALQRMKVDAHGVDVNPSNIGSSLEQGFDRVFNSLHGRWGEDGVVQGALAAIEMPFTGSGVLGCALAMDKVRSKQVWQTLGLPTAAYRVLRNADDLDGLVEELGLPLFLKPAREGSSVGAGKVSRASQLISIYEKAAKCGDDVLAEQFLSGSELTVAILDNKPLPVVRMSAANEFYDYAAKYESDRTEYFCPAGLADALEHRVRSLALEAFKALDCASWGRVDVMLDASSEPVLLEVNTIPGMTDQSLVPMAAAQAGLSFDELVIKVLESAQ